MPTLYTVGYWGMSFKEFAELLGRNGIRIVIDVRRFPTSKYPEFVKERLEENLRRCGIGYVHIRELGGYRGGYERYMETDEFRRGIGRLVELAGSGDAVIMCAEPDPRGCHRRHISKMLENMGWRIVHLKRS
jgi:uncharacterized protein (DUF488 family)